MSLDHPTLHPDVQMLELLIGTWQGTGRGEYPTIADFEYTETVTFGHVGKPFLGYAQRTADIATGLPMHSETGYWRAPGAGRIEVVMAQPTGIAEIYEGTLADRSGLIEIDVRSTSICSTSSAKDVTLTERSFELDGDELRYTFRMAAVGLPLQHHLAATLRRVPPG